MKKLMFVSLMLTMVLAAQAQLKVAPKLEKGLTRTYISTSNCNIPGQQPFNVTTETKYTVSEATADGYVIDIVATECTTDAAADNFAARLMSASEQLLKGLNMRLATNKDGKAEKIVNYDELKGQLDAGADKLIEELTKAIPQLTEAMSKETMKETILENVTEEKLLQSLGMTTNVLSLNGKTVMTGAQEEYVNEMGMKMKRMYFVNGKSVVANGSLNMTKDDMKAAIIAQVEKLAPDQAEMVKQNIDMLINSGMLKMDSKETATYELGDDSWAKSVKSEVTTDTMGQQTVITTTITQK